MQRLQGDEDWSIVTPERGDDGWNHGKIMGESYENGGLMRFYGGFMMFYGIYGMLPSGKFHNYGKSTILIGTKSAISMGHVL